MCMIYEIVTIWAHRTQCCRNFVLPHHQFNSPSLVCCYCYSKRNWYQVNGHTLDQHGKVTTRGTVMVVWDCWLVVVVRLLIGCGDCMNVTSIQPKFFGRNRIYRLKPEFHEINDKKVPIPNRQNKICFPVSCFASNLSSVVCDHLFICTSKKGTYNNMHWA